MTPIRSSVATICLVVIAVILGAGALYWLRPVMIPFILAILLTYALAPIVDICMQRLRVPRGPAIFIALCLGFFLFIGVGSLVSSSIKELAANADSYQKRINLLGQKVSQVLRDNHLEVGARSLEDQMKDLPVGKTIAKLANSLLGGISNTMLVMIFAIYLLQGASRSQAPNPVRREIERRIKRYLVIKFALSAATGGLTAAILAALDIQPALVFGILAFVLNFIPSAGSIIALLLPLPIAILEPNISVLTVTLVLVLPGIVQLVIGNVLEPKMMGDSLRLHPITILLTLVFWGMLWGVPGMLLATPITAAMRIVFDSHDGTKSLARLLAGEFEDHVAEPPTETLGPLAG